MRTLLPDHPWALVQMWDTSSAAFDFLLRLKRLADEKKATIAPFIENADYDNASTMIFRTSPRTSGYARFLSYAAALIRTEAGNQVAIPHPCPNDLTPFWHRALRDTMANLNDWRNPQIIVKQSRHALWNNAAEVAIQCSDDPNQHHSRLVVVFERYDAHDFADSDFDPWDLERRSHLTGHEPPHLRFPRRLPKPPNLPDKSIDGIEELLREARSMCTRWELEGKNYFIPPDSWSINTADREQWRQHGAFREGTMNGRRGPIDCKGRVWAWDPQHRHWDRQSDGGNYRRISHTGEEL